MIRVDAHHHVWRLDRGDYGWITPEMSIHRDYGLDDLRPLLDHLGRYGTVGLEVVLPIQPDVVYTGRVRHSGIERR